MFRDIKVKSLPMPLLLSSSWHQLLPRGSRWGKIFTTCASEAMNDNKMPIYCYISKIYSAWELRFDSLQKCDIRPELSRFRPCATSISDMFADILITCGSSVTWFGQCQCKTIWPSTLGIWMYWITQISSFLIYNPHFQVPHQNSVRFIFLEINTDFFLLAPGKFPFRQFTTLYLISCMTISWHGCKHINLLLARWSYWTTVELLVIWGAMAFMGRQCDAFIEKCFDECQNGFRRGRFVWWKSPRTFFTRHGSMHNEEAPVSRMVKHTNSKYGCQNELHFEH